MADIKAKKVLFKNRDGEYLVPYNEEVENKVSKSGDTMTGDLTIHKTGYQTLFFESTDLDYTSTEQTNINGGRILSVDKNGEYYSYFQSRVDGNGAYTTAISTRRAIENTNKSSTILAGIDKAGNVYTSAPTPATGDNSTKIATTAFVNTLALPIGMPQLALNNTLPKNCVWLEGSTVSRTTYANLFAIYGTTYGKGDGSTTFKLPDFRNRAIWGSNGFGYLSAGLPNITGTANVFVPGNVTGCFVSATGDTLGASYGINGKYISFNASKSNAIYGKSTTVQPPAIKVRVYARYK